MRLDLYASSRLTGTNWYKRVLTCINEINNKHIPVSHYSDMSSSRVTRQYTKCTWSNQDAYLRSIIRAVASLSYNDIIFVKGYIHVSRHPYAWMEHMCLLAIKLLKRGHSSFGGSRWERFFWPGRTAHLRRFV